MQMVSQLLSYVDKGDKNGSLRSVLGWCMLEDVAVLDVLINLRPEEVAGDHLPRNRHRVLGSVFNIHRSIEGPYQFPDFCLAALSVRVQDELQPRGSLKEVQPVSTC